jgi:hypothetical protein
MATQSKATLVAVNGNSVVPPVSDPHDFPHPLDGVITVKLDTGRVVEMVIGELSMLYEAGEIPNDLTSIAVRTLFPPAKEDENQREKRYWERWKIVKWLVGRVLKTKIDLNRLYHDEIWQIYNMANSPALAMDNFRRQQTEHVGDLSGQQDVGTSAEPTPEGAAA